MSSTNGYKDHPLSSVLPLMTDADLKELSEDISRNGLRAPITLYENKILDGRNRYRACQMANVEPRVRNFTTGDPIAFIVSANVHRRHLTESQRALVAAKIANLNHGQTVRAANLPISKTQSEAAQELSVSPRSVRTAKTVLRDAPAKEIKAIERGEKTISAVAKEVKAKKEKSVERLDKTGHAIPESIIPEWDRAESFAETLRALSRIKVAVESGIEQHDAIFREVTNSTVATLKNAYGDLKRVLPYAVCPTCQGRTPKKCTVCKERGFVSEFFYSTCIAEQTKRIREAAKK